MAAPRKENTEELILTATEQLLNGRLLRDISLADIAREAGISKGTIYYYFKAKEDILFALMDKHLKKQWDDLIVWSENPQKDTSLPRMVRYIIQRDIEASTLRLQFFCDAMSGNEQVKQELLRRYQDFARLIGNKLAERTTRMEDRYLSWLLLVIADGLLLQTTLDNPELDVSAFLDQTQELVRTMLLRENDA
ncbi:MAG: TetR/AcrR family transcriptional regulator [Clostridiales bacterium]|nr:TetR/AcrR family transcriptional regulator [Clostridiales bacterium]